jgi:hypothetical protein
MNGIKQLSGVGGKGEHPRDSLLGMSLVYGFLNDGSVPNV